MTRSLSFFRFTLIVILLITATFQPQSSAYAAANLTVIPITWNVVGLDSNNVNVGPNNFPVGARVCNTGVDAALNVTSSFVWDTGGTDDAGTYILLRPGSLTNYDSNKVASLAVGSCHDFYYEVQVNRNSLAYNLTRRYHITTTADTLGTSSTPTPREIFVEHLISQNRNSTKFISQGVCVTHGLPPMVLK